MIWLTLRFVTILLVLRMSQLVNWIVLHNGYIKRKRFGCPAAIGCRNTIINVCIVLCRYVDIDVTLIRRNSLSISVSLRRNTQLMRSFSLQRTQSAKSQAIRTAKTVFPNHTEILFQANKQPTNHRCRSAGKKTEFNNEIRNGKQKKRWHALNFYQLLFSV